MQPASREQLFDFLITSGVALVMEGDAILFYGDELSDDGLLKMANSKLDGKGKPEFVLMSDEMDGALSCPA